LPGRHRWVLADPCTVALWGMIS